MKAQELEERLIDFAVWVIGVVEDLPNTKAGNQIGNQLIRSGTSPAPNCGDARSAESRRDFVHKMKSSLKELRETHLWLRIIGRKRPGDPQSLPAVIAGCDELIAISWAAQELRTTGDPIPSIKNRQPSLLNRQ